MQKLVYLGVGGVAGAMLGFLFFTIYFEPLLQQGKIDIAEKFASVIPTGYATSVSESALATANIAFRSVDYESGIRIIGNELSVASNALKYGAPQQEIPLTIAMLGACLAERNEDPGRASDFEQVAVSA